MEMQYFVKPGTDEEWFETWKQARLDFYKKYGFNMSNLQIHPHGQGELAHYAKAAVDVQYLFPMGWSELEGIHNRSNFDLTQHMKFSGKSLEYFDEVNKEKFIPYVIETAVGCDRLFLAFLCDAYREEVFVDESGVEDIRVVLGLHPQIAPIKVAVLPLVKKDPVGPMAEEIFQDLMEDFEAQFDEAGSIGKRYRRQDEIGTPFCVTVDYESVEDKAVTVRHRDSMAQDRIAIDQLKTYLTHKMKG
jgi:glycyl-tRNA synthetase